MIKFFNASSIDQFEAFQNKSNGFVHLLSAAWSSDDSIMRIWCKHYINQGKDSLLQIYLNHTLEAFPSFLMDYFWFFIENCTGRESAEYNSLRVSGQNITTISPF